LIVLLPGKNSDADCLLLVNAVAALVCLDADSAAPGAAFTADNGSLLSRR
jgi:hypothetical protein